MVEPAHAAFSTAYHLSIPDRCKVLAFLSKPGDQPLACRVRMAPDMVGAKLGDQAPRALVPVWQHGARFGAQEHVAQEVALSVRVEPAGEEPLGRGIPACRAPAAVEAIGRAGRELNQQAHRFGGLLVFEPLGRLRVDPPRRPEQIGPLGVRQAQRAGQSGKGMGRRVGLAPLFQPGQPGRADPGAQGQFLAPQAGRATAPAPLCRAAFTHGAQETAQFLPGVVWLDHGGHYNRINATLVPG